MSLADVNVNEARSRKRGPRSGPKRNEEGRTENVIDKVGQSGFCLNGIENEHKDEDEVNGFWLFLRHALEACLNNRYVSSSGLLLSGWKATGSSTRMRTSTRRVAYLEIGAIMVRFIVSAARLLLMAVVLNSWNFVSSSAVRKEFARSAARW
jgi:hypothetical protein